MKKNNAIKTSIIVCSCQRSGSSLFCESLSNTGHAGIPSEYLLEMEEGELAKKNNIKTRKEYLELIKNLGTTANGVFGIKLMWNYYKDAMDKIREIEGFENMESQQIIVTLFPNPKYIWVIRKDKIAQAVSWAIAGQTGKYTYKQRVITDKKPEFNFDYINNLYKLIKESENGWKRYFTTIGVKPLKIIYEDVVEDYEGTAVRTLENLEINFPEDLKFGKRELKKQSNQLNKDWIKKYKKLKN